ncbi:hypothetical protein Tco_0842182 [Tanacetum coccineum]|uniref:Uncharacterized protein n=1 Tax=Tanacetum coccineum TaxID=301880 RepID=A0ABQ5AZ39_9ASTR
MWILGTNFIFAFPRKFWSSFRVPSYFDYRDTNLLQLFDFLVHDFYWFFYKIEFVIELKFFHWNNKGFLASVVGFVLSFRWFHGLFMVWKILPVPADGMNAKSLWYRSQFPDDGKTCRRIVLGCLTMPLRLFVLRFGIR